MNKSEARRIVKRMDTLVRTTSRGRVVMRDIAEMRKEYAELTQISVAASKRLSEMLSQFESPLLLWLSRQKIKYVSDYARNRCVRYGLIEDKSEFITEMLKFVAEYFPDRPPEEEMVKMCYRFDAPMSSVKLIVDSAANIAKERRAAGEILVRVK